MVQAIPHFTTSIMTTGMPIRLFIAVVLMGMSGCRKETLDATWTLWETGREEIICRLTEDRIGGLWACGGNTWYSGALFSIDTANGPEHPDLTTGKMLLAMAALSDGQLICTGVDGHFWRRDTSGHWGYREPSYWTTTRGIAGFRDGPVLMAGGDAFEKGFMYVIDPQASKDHLFLHQNRINDVVVVDTTSAIAAGYGIVYHSGNKGKDWQVLDIHGDHIMQLAFPTPEVGYAVGYGGSVWKSVDKGHSWKVLRNGRGIWARDWPWRGVHFRDPDFGVICGDGGLAWLTRDGGNSWVELGGLDKGTDLYSAWISGPTVILAGSGGRIFKTCLP